MSPQHALYTPASKGSRSQKIVNIPNYIRLAHAEGVMYKRNTNPQCLCGLVSIHIRERKRALSMQMKNQNKKQLNILEGIHIKIRQHRIIFFLIFRYACVKMHLKRERLFLFIYIFMFWSTSTFFFENYRSCSKLHGTLETISVILFTSLYPTSNDSAGNLT